MLGAVGGGYSNTPIGQVIAQAYLVSFTNLVHYMQQQDPGQAAASAPIQSYGVKSPIQMHAEASPASKVVRSFAVGDTVYPTGQKNGIWWRLCGNLPRGSLTHLTTGLRR
jgi:hypothetical protein